MNRRTIFVADLDRRLYLAGLGEVVVDLHWDCLAYCLMTNHVHLLVRTNEPNLGKGIQLLHSDYAQAFNERYGRVGHLFQDRFGSSRVREPGRLVSTADYIAQNPVRAGLCPTAADWRWSSSGADARGLLPPWHASPAQLVQIGHALDQPLVTFEAEAA